MSTSNCEIKFKIIQGLDHGKEFKFTQEWIVIGRDMQSDIIMNNQAVSHTHARIRFTKSGCVIEDMKSSNGVLVNDFPIDKFHLSPGDKISIGDTVLEVFYEKTTIDDIQEEDGTVVFEKKGKNASQSHHSKRILLMIAGVVIFALVIAISFYSRNKKKSFLLTDLKPIPLPAKAARGYMKQDRTHADRVVYIFSHNNETVILHYKIGGVESSNAVIILLNNKEIGKAPVSKGWSSNRNIKLAPDVLQTGKNILVFDNTSNSPTTDSKKIDKWGVKDVYLTSAKKIDCKPDQAKSFFEQGKLKHEERDISYGNLYKAIQKFKMAHKHIENCSQSYNLRNEIENKLLTAQDELKKRLDKHLFEARRAKRLGNYKIKKNEMNIIKRLIPDKNDPLYIDIKNKWAGKT